MTRTTTLWSLLLLSAALALGSCTKDATEQATGPEPEAKAASKLVFSSENAVRGELLVCFGEEAVAGIESSVMQVTRSGGVATRSGIADFDAVLGSIGVKALQRLFPVDERNEERTRAAGLHRWYVVEFDAAADLDKAALDMARIAEVSKVEFNQQLMHVHEGRVIPLAETGAAPQTRAAVGFNDPHLGKQWHYINTGDKSIYSKIKAGADVNCDEAWKLCTGDPRVIVAVVDNCVQWDHPDLAANMWTNTAELNGSEGRDDDSNGYADDIHGFNFVDNTTLTISTKGDAPDHGTHVAGTVAAVNNNGTGVAGIAGGSGKNDGVKIMSCEILGKSESGSSGAGLAGQIRAIKYAADNGAVICQNSWGDGFGENGIFYVSYYDTNIGTHNVAYTRVDDVHNYDHIYQSDLCGWVGKLGYDSDQIYGANVFEAKGSETLSAASFYATGANTQYEVYVVHDFENEKSFAQREQLASGTLQKAGYYTVDFDTKVSLKKGERYAVLVYLKTPGTKHPMAIEYDTGEKILQGVDLDDGEGYISLNGKNFVNVKEKKDCNLCIKAFTRD